MSEGGLVELGRFYDSTQAHILRGKLEAEDIQCFMFDEHHNATAWHLGIAIGGTRLMVLADDLEDAQALVHEEMGEYMQQTTPSKPLIRKPFFKTIIGTIIGFIVGAPSIRPDRKDKL